jgi:hypothetical protein
MAEWFSGMATTTLSKPLNSSVGTLIDAQTDLAIPGGGV